MSSVIPVVLRDKISVSSSVTRLVFAHPSGDKLPAFSPGSHITVVTPMGETRSYSLTDDHGDGDYYAIAVQRESRGRGGSISLIDDTRIGDRLEIGTPSNAFPLVAGDDYLFIAGGIGITAIRALHAAVRRSSGVRVRFLYLVRHSEDAAFANELPDGPDYVLHESALTGRVDLWPYLETPGETLLYCCGSSALMDEVRALTMHWNPNRVHFEDFTGTGNVTAEVPFTLHWHPTGQQVEVGPAETALDALRRSGLPALSSCAAGTCGTCVTRVIEGEPDHRDNYLTEKERADSFLPCVSRSLTACLRIGPMTSR